MGVDAVNLYRNGAAVDQSTDTWEPVQVDSTRHIDTDWTADTATNYSIAQDSAGTVILVGTAARDSNTASYDYGYARLEVNTGGGFGAISGSVVTTWHDNAFSSDCDHMPAMFAAVSGSASDEYRLAGFTPSGEVGRLLPSSNLCGFYAPDDVCYAIGSADDNGSTSFAAVSITGTGGLVEGSFSVASNAVTLPSDGDYLIFYRASCKRAANGDRDWAIRLAEDTGGGYAAIAGTELHQHTSYGSGEGHTIGGCLIHSGSASDKIQLQFQTDGANCDIEADGVALLICKLPPGWEGFSGYEATAATPGTSLGAVDLDTEWAKSGFTHDTGTNPERVTLPAATTTCLVVSVFTGQDTSATGYARSGIYRDLAGTPTALPDAYGNAAGYSSGITHTTWNAVIDSFTSADVLGLYGMVGGSASGAANSHLTILRLDNLGDVSGNLAGTSDGAATVTGTLVPPASSMAGTSDGAATVTGTLAGTGALLGSEAGAATVTGTLAATGTATGAAAGAATATGTLAGSAALTGATAGTSTATATVAGKGSMLGAVAGAATATGTLAALVYADGSAAGAATATGTLAAWAYLDGTGAGVGSGVGVLYGAGALLGTSAGAATATGICLAASSSIYDAGTVSADRSPSGAVSASRTLTGTVERY